MESTDKSTSSNGQYKWFGVGCSMVMIWSTVACLNHGNCWKGRCSSSSPSSSQSPCWEICVTSAAEVTLPGIFNLRNMCLDDGLSIGNLLWRESGRSSQVNYGCEPELGLAIGVRHMYMDARLLPGEEEKPEGAIANDCWCHAQTLADSRCASMLPPHGQVGDHWGQG